MPPILKKEQLEGKRTLVVIIRSGTNIEEVVDTSSDAKVREGNFYNEDEKKLEKNLKQRSNQCYISPSEELGLGTYFSSAIHFSCLLNGQISVFTMVRWEC